MLAGDTMAADIADASHMLVEQLLADRKILVAASGASAGVGQLFVSSLLNRFKQERPSLPAMSLSSDGATLTAIAEDSGFGEVFAKQIRALGQAGDVLLIISTTGSSGALVQAVAAAHDRQMSVLALTGRDGGDLATILDINDMELRASAESNLMLHQVHLLIALCLCDLIDIQLFGAQ